MKKITTLLLSVAAMFAVAGCDGVDIFGDGRDIRVTEDEVLANYLWRDTLKGSGLYIIRDAEGLTPFFTEGAAEASPVDFYKESLLLLFGQSTKGVAGLEYEMLLRSVDKYTLKVSVAQNHTDHPEEWFRVLRVPAVPNFSAVDLTILYTLDGKLVDPVKPDPPVEPDPLPEQGAVEVPTAQIDLTRSVDWEAIFGNYEVWPSPVETAVINSVEELLPLLLEEAEVPELDFANSSLLFAANAEPNGIRRVVPVYYALCDGSWLLDIGVSLSLTDEIGKWAVALVVPKVEDAALVSFRSRRIE